MAVLGGGAVDAPKSVNVDHQFFSTEKHIQHVNMP